MFNFHQYTQVLPNIILAFAIGLAITPILRKIGLKYEFSDRAPHEQDPNSRGYETRHHKKTTSRLGEFAMVIPLLLLMWKDLNLTTQVFGIVISIAMVAFMGAYDSKYNFSDLTQLFILIFAGVILIFTGTVINIHSIVDLNAIDHYIFNPITNTNLSLLSAGLTFAWLCVIPTALSYTGGVDGLSEGTSAIAIMILTLIGVRNGDLITVTIGSICLGGLLGLLPYNFHPAVIFSEHLIYGFVIAILAITSQAKVTTSILLLTVPLLDFIYICAYRTKKYLKENKGFSPRIWLHYLGTGDKNHFHHKLMKMGHGAVNIALIQYLMYGLLGLLCLAVSGLYLTFAVIGSIVIIVLIFWWINTKINDEQSNESSRIK